MPIRVHRTTTIEGSVSLPPNPPKIAKASRVRGRPRIQVAVTDGVAVPPLRRAMPQRRATRAPRCGEPSTHPLSTWRSYPGRGACCRRFSCARSRHWILLPCREPGNRARSNHRRRLQPERCRTRCRPGGAVSGPLFDAAGIASPVGAARTATTARVRCLFAVSRASGCERSRTKGRERRGVAYASMMKSESISVSLSRETLAKKAIRRAESSVPDGAPGPTRTRGDDAGSPTADDRETRQWPARTDLASRTGGTCG